MNTDHFCSALTKLDESTAKTVHLTPQEARAVLEYIASHGLSAGRLAAYWRSNGRKRYTNGATNNGKEITPTSELG